MGAHSPGRVRPKPATPARPGPPPVVLPGIVAAAERRELVREAGRLRAGATRNERPHTTLTVEGRALCTVRNWYADGGETARTLQRSVFGPRLRDAFGEELFPSHSTYLYYARDDHLGIHKDHPSCELSLLTWLCGPAGSVRFHPELVDLSERDIWALAVRYAGHPDGGVDLDLERGSVAVRGRDVPHHRLPHPRDGELAVATFCFASTESACT